MAKKTLTQQAEELRALIPQGYSVELEKLSGLSSRWVRYFRAGKIDNPGVQTLDALAAALRKLKR